MNDETMTAEESAAIHAAVVEKLSEINALVPGYLLTLIVRPPEGGTAMVYSIDDKQKALNALRANIEHPAFEETRETDSKPPS